MARSDAAMIDVDLLFAGDSETARLLRSYDWSSSPLGAPSTWPAVWRTAMRSMLDAAFPVCMMLDPGELWYFHNDLYIPFLGTKHPSCMGRPAREVWAEVYEELLAPMFRQVLTEGHPLLRQNMRFELLRQGTLEECYFTFTYNPLRDFAGAVIGIYVICIETTATVLAQRRLDCLRQLSARVFAAETAQQACDAASQVIAASACEDCPGALLYLVDDEGKAARRTTAVGLFETKLNRLPAVVSLASEDPEQVDSLQIPAVLRARAPQSVPGLAARVGADSSIHASALPILNPDGERVVGVLIALLTPLRPVEEVCDFLKLIANQISAALANARAKEHAVERANALAALDRAKTAFFSNISHELRTPLTLVMGPLTQVLASSNLQDDERALLELVRRGGARLHKLIKSLLDFSRVEAGRIEARYEPLDLAAFTRDVASMFATAFELAGVSFVVDAPPLPEAVYVDRDMWEKIVLNLLSNALKFTFEGQAKLTLRAEAGEARLSVSDTGCGIAPEHLPRIFERFYWVAAPRARTQEGSGIGLSLVRELANLHGGRAFAESEPGRGTTIHVRIPLGSDHLAPEHIGRAHYEMTDTFAQLFREEALSWLENGEAATRPPALRTQERADDELVHGVSSPRKRTPADDAPTRIVLADDNRDMRAYLRRILGERWEVHAVADGSAALELTRSLRPDLVLADVMMPRLDGFALLAAIQADEALARIPVLLVSARAGEEASAQAIALGAADYVVKPFSARELVARVEGQLTQARLQNVERAMREAAEREVRARERFLAVLSHELRTPLSAMQGWTELLRRGLLGPQEVERALAVIEQSVGVQRRLIEDLLDLSRIVAGRLPIKQEPIANLSPEVDVAVDALRLVAGEKGVHLETAIESFTGPLVGDAERLQQMVSNLVGNAIKFTPAGGSVRVSCQRRSGELMFQVRDTGRGIDPAALPHIFDEYWMGGDHELGRREGLGLGLAIARSIVVQHGGTVKAASAGLGRGATFTVTLPLADSSSTAPRVQPSNGSARERRGRA